MCKWESCTCVRNRLSREMIESFEYSAVAVAATPKAFRRLFQLGMSRSKSKGNMTNSTLPTADMRFIQRTKTYIKNWLLSVSSECSVPMLNHSLLIAFMLHLWLVRFLLVDFFFGLITFFTHSSLTPTLI